MLKGEKTHREFVKAYFASDRNALQAYLAIKPKVKHSTAGVQGCRLLKNPKVQALIEEHELAMQAKFDISEERVLREIARLAFFDIRKLYREDGSLKLPSEWDDDTAAAIAGMDVEDLYYGKGDNREQIGSVRKYKTHSKPDSHEKLMKYLGMYEKDNRQKTDPVRELLAWVGKKGSHLEVRK